MENFFVDDKFYTDLEDLMCDYDMEEDLSNVDDDWSVNVAESKLEPVVTLSAEWICDRINQERFGEDGEGSEDVWKLLNSLIDFEKVNAAMPKFYYATRENVTLTKQDLIDYCK